MIRNGIEIWIEENFKWLVSVEFENIYTSCVGLCRWVYMCAVEVHQVAFWKLKNGHISLVFSSSKSVVICIKQN